MKSSPPHKTTDVIVVGGGAAGFFGAINIALQNPSLRIAILEKTTKLLTKVKVSGGGRCNVTHHTFESTPLSQHYPRGQKELKKMFRAFQAADTVRWFEQHGVLLKTEEDGRMFPTTDESQTIVDCFLRLAEQLNIRIETSIGVTHIRRKDKIFLVETTGERTIETQGILVAIGGHNNSDAYSFLRELGHRIVPVIPSLFTFNDSGTQFKDLMGLSVADAEIRITGSKFTQRGPILITHWGLSGPAVIKLSAWAAEHLHQLKYEFGAMVNWTGDMTEETLRASLILQRQENGKRKIISHPLAGIPQRLWERLLTLSGISGIRIWSEAPNKEINRLIEHLLRCPFQFKGKTTFKEEFVSCGGVDLEEVDLETMQSKIIPGVWFAGEVLNIDGETGGFNFQSAWTTSFLAARSIARP